MTRSQAPLLALLPFALLGGFGACQNTDSPGRNSPADAAAAAPEYDAAVVHLDAAANDDAGADADVPPTGPSPFARPCDSDDECAPGLLCLRSDQDVWLTGGPAHGYCSLECDRDPTSCQRYDVTSVCMSGDAMGHAYCLKACVLGDAFGEKKCADRQDVSCAMMGFRPVCMPNCGGDADCPAGRYCNHHSGTCTSGVSSGDPPGTACDPNLPNTCSAYCSKLSNGEGVCSGVCTLGADYTCDVPASSADVVGLPLCMTFREDRAGDAGICVQRCRCNADCDHPSAYCDLEVAEAEDGVGVCLFDFEADAGTPGVQCDAADGDDAGR